MSFSRTPICWSCACCGSQQQLLSAKGEKPQDQRGTGAANYSLSKQTARKFILALVGARRYKSRFCWITGLSCLESQHLGLPISLFFFSRSTCVSLHLLTPHRLCLLLSSPKFLQYSIILPLPNSKQQAYLVPGGPCDLIVSYRRAAFPEQAQDPNYKPYNLSGLSSLRYIQTPIQSAAISSKANLERAFYPRSVC